MGSDPQLLRDALVALAAAVVLVPIAKRIGLGSVLGYLLAGVLVGPHVLGLIGSVESIMHFAEFGIVLMLFLIGLELDLKRLWQMRLQVFGGGALQMAACALPLGLGLWAAGLAWQGALVAGLALAMSSTAIAMQLINERNLMGAPVGRAGFAVLLFQDIAAIPLMALVPILAASGGASGEPGWIAALKAAGAIAAVIVLGRYLVRPVIRRIVQSEVREIFTAFALVLVVGIAWLMASAGLSMALGAFLAGVLLASSEYRHLLQADIAPFKGLLLGLFFISVGMAVDLGLVLEHPLALAALLVGLLAAKFAMLALIAPRLRVQGPDRWLLAALLCQGGEFAFVVFALARQAQLLVGAWDALLTAAVALSMGATPLVVAACERWATRLHATTREDDAIEDEHAPVIIAGFGRYGQIVGRLLFAHGVSATVIDHDPEQVDLSRKLDFKVYYGDATRLDLLEAAGADRARVLVIAIDGVEDSLELVDRARARFPALALVARARNVRHELELAHRGVTLVQRETFESALRSGRSVLEALGVDPYEARELADAFRRHNFSTLRAMVRHTGDRDRLLDISRSGRQELEENLRRDREARAARRSGDWTGG